LLLHLKYWRVKASFGDRMTSCPVDNGIDPADDTGWLSAQIRLVNKRGLHARASAKFIKCVEGFDAVVQVTSLNDVCEETVMADSIMELLMLGSACGEEIIIRTRGPEAKASLAALTALVERAFGETE